MKRCCLGGHLKEDYDMFGSHCVRCEKEYFDSQAEVVGDSRWEPNRFDKKRVKILSNWHSGYHEEGCSFTNHCETIVSISDEFWYSAASKGDLRESSMR